MAVLGGSLAAGLAPGGVRVAVLGRRLERAEERVDAICREGTEATALTADVLDEAQLRWARDQPLAARSHIDILVNAAGGECREACVATA